MTAAQATPEQIAAALGRYLKDKGNIPPEFATGPNNGFNMISQTRHSAVRTDNGVTYFTGIGVGIDDTVTALDGDRVVTVGRNIYQHSGAHFIPVLLAKMKLDFPEIADSVVDARENARNPSAQPVIEVGGFNTSHDPGRYTLGIRIPTALLPRVEELLTQRLQAQSTPISVATYGGRPQGIMSAAAL